MGGEMWESEMYIQDSKTLSTPTTGKSIDKLLLNSKNHGYVMKGFALEAGGALKLQPAEVEAGSKLINPVRIKLAMRESQLNEDKSSVDASHYEHWVISFPRKSIGARKDHTYCPKVAGLPRLLIQEAKTFIGVIIRLETRNNYLTRSACLSWVG
jgi:hypothetical protein